MIESFPLSQTPQSRGRERVMCSMPRINQPSAVSMKRNELYCGNVAGIIVIDAVSHTIWMLFYAAMHQQLCP